MSLHPIAPGNGTADIAVRLAAQGMRVLPVWPNTKRPRDDGWPDLASDNSLRVAETWPGDDFNVGIACGHGLLVIDVDVKGGALGRQSLAALPALPETRTVRTPSGGYHYYFRTAEDAAFGNTRTALGPGIDVRSSGGQVLAPGSRINGRPYVLEKDLPPAPAPGWLLDCLQQAPARTAEPGTSIGELDTPETLTRCRAWIEAAPEVFEGSRDNAGIQVAYKFYDYGVSQPVCLELLHEWNDTKVFPPLEDSDLERLSISGMTSRRDVIGRDNPTAGLASIEHPPKVKSAFERSIIPYRDTLADLAAIPQRRWLASRRLIRGKITVLVAPGSSGKSLLTLEWACALALGSTGDARPSFCGLDVCERVNVLVINAEDDTVEMRKRLGGAIKEFRLPETEVIDRVFLQSSQDAGSPSFIVARRNKKTGEVEETTDAQSLIDFVRANDIGSVFVDPYVDTHTTQESDNGDANAVMRIYKRIASETDAAIVLVHHTRKPGVASSESYVGNPDSARGAGAIINAARVALTLYPMSEKDGDKLHIAKAIRHRYVRLDDAKANYSLASPSAEWFEKRTVQLPNGDEVGVLVPVTLEKASAAEPTREQVEAVYARLALATESGGWEKLSCSPFAGKRYLPRAFSDETGLLEWVPIEAIEAALSLLEKTGRAERVQHGRPGREGGIPERWRAVTSASESSLPHSREGILNAQS